MSDEKEKPLSKALIRTLKVFAEFNQPVGAKWVAKKLWPDSPGWTRTSNCGRNGAMRGKGPTIAAAVMVNKLYNRGLLRTGIGPNKYRYELSYDGEKLLKELKDKGD